MASRGELDEVDVAMPRKMAIALGLVPADAA